MKVVNAIDTAGDHVSTLGESIDALGRTIKEHILEYNELELQRNELLGALISLEQAYSNKHSPQHRADCLNVARVVIEKAQFK